MDWNKFVADNKELLLAILGVVGTLLGTILGWFLNELSSVGKLRVFVTSWKENMEFFDQGRGGQFVPSASKEGVQHYWYDLCIDIYNSSGKTKIMRNIVMEFRKGRKVLISQTPYDDATKILQNLFYRYCDVEAINIS